MNWHTRTVTGDRLGRLLRRIRTEGGTVTSCRRDGIAVRVTWLTH